MPRLFTSVLILVVLCAAAAPLTAQEGEQPAPAHVSAVEGTAVLEREGRGEDLALNMPLLVGDRLRTDEGRAEALLPDGSVLALDRHSMADLLAGGLVRLTAGRMVFVVASAGAGQGAREYQVDAPGGAIRMAVPGEYRISLLGSPERPAVGLAVVRGQATLAGDRGSLVVNAGEQSAVASGEGPQATVRFNSAQPDAFYAWADERRAERVGARSNTYLPEELRVYGGTFDRYGSWQEAPEPGIGYVWYPRVAVDWRPYYYGSWWSYPSWGWTWVGYDPWAWPTHHYGRWGFGIGGWYWIPARSWGPAWVAWGGAPGYAAWCPLGYWGGPVFSFGVHLSFGGHHYSHWHGWSVVPHHAFSRPYHHVGAYAVNGSRLPPGTRNAFAVHNQGPRGLARGGTAVPRSWASGTAVPRGGVRTEAGSARPVNPGTNTGGFASAGGAATRGSAGPNGTRSSAFGAGTSTAVPRGGAAAPSNAASRPSYAGSPAATGRAPFAGSRPSYAAPSSGSARPSYGSTRPPNAAARQPYAGSRPSYGAPSSGTARPSHPGSRPSFDAPPSGTARPSYPPSRPSYAAPSAGTARPSYGGARPSFGAPSRGTARPSYAPSGPSYGGPSPGAARPSYGGSRPSYGSAVPRGFSGAARPSYGGGAPRASSGAGAPRPSSGFAVPRGSSGGGGGAVRSSGGARPSGGARRPAAPARLAALARLAAPRPLTAPALRRLHVAPWARTCTLHFALALRLISWPTSSSASPGTPASSRCSCSPPSLGIVSGILFAYAGDLPQISALDDYTPNTITRVLRRERPGRRRVRHRAARGREVRRHLAAAAPGDPVGRGRGLRPPLRRQRLAHRHHRGRGRRQAAAGRGEHAHAAARAQAVPDRREDVGAEDQGGAARDPDREALHQARDLHASTATRSTSATARTASRRPRGCISASARRT